MQACRIANNQRYGYLEDRSDTARHLDRPSCDHVAMKMTFLSRATHMPGEATMANHEKPYKESVQSTPDRNARSRTFRDVTDQGPLFISFTQCSSAPSLSWTQSC